MRYSLVLFFLWLVMLLLQMGRVGLGGYYIYGGQNAFPKIEVKIIKWL